MNKVEEDARKVPTPTMIGHILLQAIEMNKIPKGSTLDMHAYTVLANIIDKKKVKGDPIPEIIAFIVAYMRGYIEGISYTMRDKELGR